MRAAIHPILSVRLWAVLLVAGLAAGCGKDEGKKLPTQLAAKVNSDEITIHQVNTVLARNPSSDPQRTEQVKREVLDRLIDQQLAMQQAIHRKLDRTPAVQQALEAARSDILARAYMEQIATLQPKPTPDETKKYYAEHPELFAQRRIYALEEIAFEAPEATLKEARARATKARSLKELADWLQSQRIAFAPSRGVRAAEQLPLEILPRLHKAAEGDVVLVELGNNRLQVIRLASVKSEPVDEAAATPRIQQYLFNRRTSEAIAAEMKQLRSGASIELMGEFGQPLASAVERAKEADTERRRAEAEAKARQQAEAEARSAEATKARLAAEARARLEAEERAKASDKSVQLPQESIKKGVLAR